MLVKLCPSGVCILVLGSVSLSMLINRKTRVSTANLHEFCCYLKCGLLRLTNRTERKQQLAMQTDCFMDIRFGNVFLHPWIVLIIKKKSPQNLKMVRQSFKFQITGGY